MPRFWIDELVTEVMRRRGSSRPTRRRAGEDSHTISSTFRHCHGNNTSLKCGFDQLQTDDRGALRPTRSCLGTDHKDESSSRKLVTVTYKEACCSATTLGNHG